MSSKLAIVSDIDKFEEVHFSEELFFIVII